MEAEEYAGIRYRYFGATRHSNPTRGVMVVIERGSEGMRGDEREGGDRWRREKRTTCTNCCILGIDIDVF